MAAITLNNIVKRYGDGYLAVNDVSLDIADGEFVILVGPSGCGKSTLLRMIVGLEDITSGDLTIGGKRVNDRAPRDRNLAMVFQNYALYPHLTVFENIAFPLRLQKGKFTEAEVKQRVEDAAKTLELQEHLERKPANLSGGQRQRVAMGRAIVREARRVPVRRAAVEPRRQAARADAHRDRAPAAPARHHHGLRHARPDRGDDARRPGRRAAQGRCCSRSASPRELYEQPVNLFVAGFIGSPPMNFLPATVVDDAPCGCRSPTCRSPPEVAAKARGPQARHRRAAARALRGRLAARPGQAQHRRRRSSARRRHRVARLASCTPTSRSTPTRTWRASSRSSTASSTARGCGPSWSSPSTRESKIRDGSDVDAVVRPGACADLRPGVGREPELRRRTPHARSTRRTRRTARRPSSGPRRASQRPPDVRAARRWSAGWRRRGRP